MIISEIIADNLFSVCDSERGLRDSELAQEEMIASPDLAGAARLMGGEGGYGSFSIISNQFAGASAGQGGYAMHANGPIIK